ncbi:hypothetical protein LCGC14_2239700 [marine sediment metagenome]|uniref:Uncharacterized protein n=1 Tax=marine sediment metagenome TaxID=412755 RepID=A0A0F9G0U3_9ZZZZ
MNLIERLRRQVEFLIEFWGGDPEDPDHAGLRLYREAADEIERLGQCQFEPSGDNHHNADGSLGSTKRWQNWPRRR